MIGAGSSVGRALSRLLVSRSPDQVRLFDQAPGAIAGHRVEALPNVAADLAGVDAVVQLTGMVHTADGNTDYQAANVDAPVAMARIAQDAGIGRFVFQSSLSVNGRWCSDALTPGAAFAPDGRYGASNVAAEQALQSLLKDSSTALAIFRPPLVYGPGLGTKFDTFVRAARIGLPLPTGLASARRSMVSLANLTDAILHLCRHGHADKAPVVLLPADDRDLMVREIYATLCRMTGKGAWQVPVPVGVMHAALRLAGREETFDSLFRPSVIDREHWSDVGWSPPQTVETGLLEAITGSA